MTNFKFNSKDDVIKFLEYYDKEDVTIRMHSFGQVYREIRYIPFAKGLYLRILRSGSEKYIMHPGTGAMIYKNSVVAKKLRMPRPDRRSFNIPVSTIDEVAYEIYQAIDCRYITVLFGSDKLCDCSTI